MRIFQECLALIPQLRTQGVAVERELARIQEQAKTYPPAHQQLMAIRFYLQYALWECQNRWFHRHGGINNYSTLIREIDRWRYEFNEYVCFVTFNYDTILEESVSQVLGFKTPDLNCYVEQRFYSVIKLHGSVNWGRRIAVPGNPETYGYKKVISEAENISFCEDYVTVNSTFNIAHCLVPALSIPVEKKDDFSCPKAHISKLEQLLPSVTKVLIIGWRATEADFLNMLHSKLNGTVDLMIVSGSEKDADETLRNIDLLQVRYPGQNRVEVGFSGLIDNLGLLDAFLRTPTS